MRVVSILLIIGIVTGLAVTTSPAETMRCGTDFIKINDSAFIVVKNGFYYFVTMTGGHVSAIRSERP